MCAIVFCFYPETKGRSLEEIDLIFGDVKQVEGVLKNSGRPASRSPLDDEKLKQDA